MKIFVFFLFLLFPAFVFSGNYHDAKINGIYYKLDNSTKEATVVMGQTFDNTAFTTPIEYYSGNVTIPPSIYYDNVIYTVTTIDGNRFGDPVSYYSYAAFQDCNNLTSITIPNTIKKIGPRAFDGCTSLKSVYISDMQAWCQICFDIYKPEGRNAEFHYYPETNPLYYAHNLFLNGEKVSSLVIPDNITVINEGSFIGCSISSVIIHKNVTTLCSKAFDQCSSLKDVHSYSPSITPPDNYSNNIYSFSTKDISYFSGSGNITLHIRKRYSNNYTEYNGYYPIWNGFGKTEYIEGVDYHLIYIVDDEEYKNIWYEVGEAIVPENEPTKSGYSFSGWSEIPEIMPDHDVTVTGSFITNKYKLSYKVDNQVYKSYEVEYNSDISPEENPTKKGMTFSGWSNIPGKMPAQDVTVTGSFSWSEVKDDNITYRVTDPEEERAAVIGNDNATGAITIASTVDFDYTYSVTSISDKAFYGCANIATVEIPATVTYIGERAFANIDKLTDVTILATDLPETDRTAFENSYIEDYVTLHVPEASLEKYKTTAPWKNFKEVVGIAGPKKCATPTITFAEGKVKFACETEGVTFKYEIKNADNFEGEGDEIEVGGVYNVSVYATKEDYIDSDKATMQIKLSTVKGDINGDGKVDVSDHVELSNIIMGIHEEEAEVEQEETE